MDKEYVMALLGYAIPLKEDLIEKDFLKDLVVWNYLTEEEKNFYYTIFGMNADKILRNKKDITIKNYEEAKKTLINMQMSLVMKSITTDLISANPHHFEDISKTFPIKYPNIPGLANYIKEHYESAQKDEQQ